MCVVWILWVLQTHIFLEINRVTLLSPFKQSTFHRDRLWGYDEENIRNYRCQRTEDGSSTEFWRKLGDRLPSSLQLISIKQCRKELPSTWEGTSHNCKSSQEVVYKSAGNSLQDPHWPSHLRIFPVTERYVSSTDALVNVSGRFQLQHYIHPRWR